jgi:hypothetical protein
MDQKITRKDISFEYDSYHSTFEASLLLKKTLFVDPNELMMYKNETKVMDSIEESLKLEILNKIYGGDVKQKAIEMKNLVYEFYKLLPHNPVVNEIITELSKKIDDLITINRE